MTLEDYYALVSDLVDESERMSAWEYDFVNSVAEYEEDGRVFSDAQMQKIEELHGRYC